MVCMTSQAEPELPLPEPHSVLVTEDGGVRKLILHAGTGALVPLHSRCLGMLVVSESLGYLL